MFEVDNKKEQKKYKRKLPPALKKEMDRNVSTNKEWGSYNASIPKIVR
jgi:hypothetical protein